MRSLSRVFKTASLLSVGIAAGYFGGKFGVLYNPFQARDNRMLYQFDSITKEHQGFLKENHYVEPQFLYDLHQKRTQMNTFFEKALLMDIGAFKMLDFFVTKDIYELLCNEKASTGPRDVILNKSSLACVFNTNDNVQGHMGVVHGGFTATLIDSFFGAYGYLLNDMKPVATANLQIKYKKPMKVGKEYMLVCEVEKIEGKSFFLKSYVRDPKGVIYCESTARFAKVDWQTMLMRNLFKEALKKKEEMPSITTATDIGVKVPELAMK